MKKILIVLTLFLSINQLQAHPYYSHHGCSNCVYVVKSDVFHNEYKPLNCSKHLILVDTTINFYSNGAKRTFYNYSVLNEDGTAIISDCSDLKHIEYNKKHYFLAKKNGYYKILDENGLDLTKRKYTKMIELIPNRILVRVNKLYGIIDTSENIIVPIKYKSIEEKNTNLFLTKLNKYYGLIDSDNNILFKNEYDKIKPLYDTYLIKRKDKFGLVDLKGKIILNCEYDKIKKIGEYIVIKKDKKYGILNSLGEKLTEVEYKKVKLERNQLFLLKDKQWENI